jgi:hypothetical protein
MQNLLTFKKFAPILGMVLFVLCADCARAQSTDVAWPAPVRLNEVTGKIAARDIGDPRLTDHYFAFTGTPGDLLITIDSNNLNGDIDVFTYTGLRPLLKFTVYAGASSPTTKSLYLRKQEDLILRVEGRTPNDDDATYRLRFGGAFLPITSGPLAEHEEANQSNVAQVESARTGRRVSSVGARVEEPRREVAEAPSPEPTPVETREAEPKTASAKPPSTTRTRRPATPTTRRTRPAPKPQEEETVAETETKPAETSETPAEKSEAEVAATPRRPTRRGRAAKATPKPAEVVQEPEDTGPKLIIETNDGTLIDRFMTTVRRVTVENGQVVVVGKDGKIQRVPLASVVRMTIAP